MSRIYTDKQSTIRRLDKDDSLTRIVECRRMDGKLVGALYELNGGERHDRAS